MVALSANQWMVGYARELTKAKSGEKDSHVAIVQELRTLYAKALPAAREPLVEVAEDAEGQSEPEDRS